MFTEKHNTQEFKVSSTMINQQTHLKMTKINIISRENIKPSSPTPQHLKTFNLSVLHQHIPAPYAPIIFFYPNYDNATELQIIEHQEHLKISLSQTLTHFYPLAGTIKDDFSIDCDDAGARYATMRVDTSLPEFLKHLDLGLINGLLPCDPTFDGLGVVELVLCISHKILDGTALATFVKCWASIHRENARLVPDLTVRFLPATDSRLRDSSMAMWASLIKFGKCSTGRFVFDRFAITKLKAEAGRNGVQQPTRVEVVSALLWKCVMAASKETHGFNKPSLLGHSVNLRKRSGTVLSENSIGNLVWLASAESGTMADIKLHDLVNQVKGSILKINSEFVTKLQGDNGPQVMEESLKLMKDCGTNGSLDYIGITSWCKMGFYEVDFGRGKPLWVCGHVSHGSPVFTDFIVLMDTRDGDGIEAWVNLDEHKMHILRHDPELLAFASLDPSPLQICEVDN
ncbi:putative alcohol O-acetyltransferase [Helianthus debilis subsp. tardiflorus]